MNNGCGFEPKWNHKQPQAIQAHQRLGKIAERLLVGLLGPQQPCKRGAGVWAIGLGGQIG